MSLAGIPPDIFYLVAHLLPLRDVMRLCQVSKQFWEYGRRDKRLWLECLRREVISKGIVLPRYRRSIEEASAEEVHAWIKTSITLHNAYKLGGRNARVTSFVLDGALEATWTKIVRGRWCLVALSNLSTSFLGVWEIYPDGSVELQERFYLPGPVLDGVVDDDMVEVRIAITVGTTIPYIYILMLGVKEHAICLLTLQTLEGARHVLLLCNFLVGYRTLCGDDTYPLVTDWRTGATMRLFPSHFRVRPYEPVGDIHIPCQAMGMWRNCIFAVFSYYVEIFPFPSFEVLSALHTGVQCLCFPKLWTDTASHWIGEAYILDVGYRTDGLDQFSVQESLLISIRDRYGNLYKRAIVQTEDLSFAWNPEFLDDPKFDVMSYRHCVGASSEYQLRLASEEEGDPYPVFLDIHRYLRSSSGNLNSGSKQRLVISNPALPILDLTTAMDFDDAAGVILLGSCRGEISVVQFADRLQQCLKCLRDELPRIAYDFPQVETTPICLDLPVCYYLHDKIYEGSVPAAVCEEVMNSWYKACDSPKIKPPPGWSTDWTRHSSFQNWVLPFPRWRTLAADQPFHFYDTWNRIVSYRLGHGDIVPIMYKEDDHDLVIFRIANRVYYFLRGPPSDPNGHLVCALPFSPADLENPRLLAHLWCTRWKRTPLCHRRGDGPSRQFLYMTNLCLMVINYLKTDSFKRVMSDRSMSEDLRTWSLEDREILFRMASDLWEAEHKCMNPPPQDDDDFS